MKGKFLASLFAAAVVAIGFASGSAQAVPINGDLSFIGTFTVDTPGNLATATKFTSFSGVTVMSEPAVDNGDYTPVEGLAATFTSPFVFSPSGVGGLLWSIVDGDGKHYTFTTTSVGVSAAGHNFLVVEGEGIAHIDGKTDTAGFWNITANKARASFSFSSSASASFVPEPASIGVAALGLGTILLRRRRVA